MKLFIDDAVTRSLLPEIEKCADFIKNALRGGRRPVVRFHNDSDGIVSALLLSEALNNFLKENKIERKVRSFQTTSATFTIEDAALEISNARSTEVKPLLFLLDHGANAESTEALSQTKKNGFGTVILDHHPLLAPEAAALVDFLVTPFHHGGDSNYTTGLIAFEVAKRIHLGVEGKQDLVEISFEGDRSKFSSSPEGKTTIALDYKATYLDYPNCLPAYKKFLDDQNEVQAAYEQAQDKLRVALEKSKAFTKTKHTKNGFTVLVVKLKFKEGAYPSKGRIMTVVKEKYCSENPGAPVVAVGHGNDKILIRASREAFEKGFKANSLIKTLKNEFPNAVFAGGGHEAAACMRVNKKLALPLIRRFVDLIEQII